MDQKAKKHNILCVKDVYKRQLLLMHNAKLIDKKGELLNKTLFEIRPPKKGYARNIL